MIKDCKNCLYWVRTPFMDDKKISSHWARCCNGMVGGVNDGIIPVDYIGYDRQEDVILLFKDEFGCKYWKQNDD